MEESLISIGQRMFALAAMTAAAGHLSIHIGQHSNSEAVTHYAEGRCASPCSMAWRTKSTRLLIPRFP
jgi:hypothetical protein